MLSIEVCKEIPCRTWFQNSAETRCKNCYRNSTSYIFLRSVDTLEITGKWRSWISCSNFDIICYCSYGRRKVTLTHVRKLFLSERQAFFLYVKISVEYLPDAKFQLYITCFLSLWQQNTHSLLLSFKVNNVTWNNQIWKIFVNENLNKILL